MLQVSPNNIELRAFQKRYNIQLSNNSEYPLIFKIRSTNTFRYSIEPNAGFIRPGTALSLMVTVKMLRPFNEKIQISYSRTFAYGLSFEEAWGQIMKMGQPVRSAIVNISFSQQQETRSQQKVQKEVQLRLSKITPVRRRSIDQIMERYSTIVKKTAAKYNSVGMPQIRQNEEFKDLIAERRNLRSSHQIDKMVSHFEKERRKFIDAQEREELIFELEELEKKLKKERNWTARLRQQLQIAEEGLRQNSRGSDHSLGEVQPVGVICEQHHLSLTGLALLALAAFIVGYALATFG